MDKTQIFILAIVAVFCFIVAAGCTTVTTTAPPPNPTAVPTSVPTAGHYPAVSINATPVRYAHVNGVDLGYREFGSGEPILLQEGFGATMDIAWNETFLGILATKYHVYTYDYRGVGYSSDSNGNHTIAQYADDAAALMPALGYSSMNVYGESMGSTVSQQLVIDHPERVRKLVLDSVTYSIRLPETQVLFNVINSVANNTTPEPVGVQKEAFANLAWNGSWDGLSGIQKNTMLVVGTDDVLTPQTVTVQIAGQINGSWLVRFKDLPHIGSRYAPVEYGENALDFLGMNESPPYINP
ncbi:MAG TPA: alpha/beta hydrolase [Methanoregulaceae archaeon]|nr:alpha/beta hydrolase [Methanoregulaceae archaeon]